MSYIEPSDVPALCAVLLTLTWFGFIVDASKIGKTFPGVAAILCAGLALSNLHLTPFNSSVAEFVHTNIVAAAIPLLMLKADLKKIFIESGRVMMGFAAACVGVVTGVLIGYAILQPWHIGAKVAGMYAGAFIGGTISMVAVANAVAMTPAELSAATGASMIPSVLGLMALVALPTLKITQRYMKPRAAEATDGAALVLKAQQTAPELRLTHISGALALAFVLCAVARIFGRVMAQWTGHDQSQYHILYVTALTVIVANVFPRPLRKIRGEFEIGMIFMYMFFAVIGLATNIMSFLDHALSLFFFVIILLTIGIVISMVLAKLLRLDIAEAVTGCGAAIVGPVATVAVVAGKGWYSMVSPAVMIGILCHIVGNFVGISVAALLR